jgi:pimeloyl-ACP methyl ester carboxylesterase/protein-tyrosine phosphatase
VQDLKETLHDRQSLGQSLDIHRIYITHLTMDTTRQLGERALLSITSRGQSFAIASTALVTVAFLAYRLIQPQFITKESDLPERGVNRILRLRDGSVTENYDPPLLQKHSDFKSYTTSYATYRCVRTFYHPHPQAERLPQDSRPLPLLVFLHGLGGSLAQFAPLLGSLVNIAPCLGIDLPGCGLSRFDAKSWDAYSLEALATLVSHVVDQHRAMHGHKDVVLIGHSMGCSLAVLLASTTSPLPLRSQNVIGVVAICPKGTPPTKKETWYFGKILNMPDFVLDIMRWLDRRGGINSPSVTRFVGEKAGPDLRKLQLRFNSSFPTSVWKRMAWGLLPVYDDAGRAHGGMPGRSVWSGINVPLFLIAGQSDTVTKPEEISVIVSYLKNSPKSAIASDSYSIALPAEAVEGEICAEDNRAPNADDTKFGLQPSTTESKSQHCILIKTAILPAPASHALLYDHSTCRTLAGLIEDFLSHHISHRLNLGWQLQQLATSGKWDVKNLKKWQGVEPVSEPIADGLFRGMKTLRDQDEDHTPAVFAQKWKDKIYAIIDISHDSPVYDPKVLEQNGIHYHKVPTVSKIPPNLDEVRDFINLVDRLRSEIDLNNSGLRSNRLAIAVHCHYGYNRTGFFIISYLIEKEGYRVQDAVDEFEKKRPPGIRHEHFVDTLYVRYCVGLRRAPSMNSTE